MVLVLRPLVVEMAELPALIPPVKPAAAVFASLALIKRSGGAASISLVAVGIAACICGTTTT